MRRGSMRRVFITKVLPPQALNLLGGFSLDIFPRRRNPTRREIMRGVKGADGLLCFLSDVIDREIMDAGNLGVISNCAAGYNNIDIEYATQRGIAVTNTPDVLTNATADLTLALMLAVTRRICEAEDFLRKGKFRGWELFLLCGMELAGKRLGIVGMGRIGKEVARRAQGFGMEILYHSRKEEEGIGRVVSLGELLKKSDIVTLHVPLTPDTFHLIGDKELDSMKRSAYLINTSRGPVVDEGALVRALKEKRIAGAGLDVYENEPKLTRGLLTLKNVVLLPHIGSATLEARMGMVLLAVQNLKDVLEGKKPAHIVNPSVLI
jgi:glyoxylate reductase